MYKEIGSNFWLNRCDLPPTREISLDYLGVEIDDAVYLSTGRSAISFVLEHIDNQCSDKVALLPPFTCHTVIEPFLQTGYDVHYYTVDKKLECDSNGVLTCIKRVRPSVILFHGYFGFNTLRSIQDVIASIRGKGLTVIEDVTQTLYSEFEHLDADFYIGSFRKWGPLPDGGFAASTGMTFQNTPIQTDLELQEAKLRAFHAKHLYMAKNQGDKRHFLQLFRFAEEMLSKQQQYFAMGNVSRSVQAHLDLEFLRKRRRSNYRKLLHILERIEFLTPVFDALPEGVTPLYFPVYVERERKAVQQYLAENDIYCPIIWPKPSYCNNAVSQDIDWIYDHILAIPCDQRYGNDDMERIGHILAKLQQERIGDI